ncbi:MAG: hypothetical protein ACOX6T_18065 [Myxococcales bacterium]|jgi:hypothetical protein
MRALSCRAFFLAVAFAFACGAQESGDRLDVPPEDEPILLALGEQRTIKFPGMSHAAVGDPSIVDLDEFLDSEQCG